MARQLDTETLDGAARYYAGIIMLNQGVYNRKWAMNQLYNFTFKDEFEHVYARVQEWLTGKVLEEFESRARDKFAPRDDIVFKGLLQGWLAIDPDGNHIPGAIGRTQVGVRKVGLKMFDVETPGSIRRRKKQGLPIHMKGRDDREVTRVIGMETWPIYVGETEERVAGNIKHKIGLKGPGADPLPPGAIPLPVGANVTNLSAEAAIAAVDAVADRLDEGSTAANIRVRTGSQPADPDATETGTLLGTLVCSDPAVNAGVDDTDGTVSATYDTVTADSSADATGTAGYCRVAATGTGADDHIDGNAGTVDEAFIFNTTSIVSGAQISLTSASIRLDQGSTAT